MTKLEEFLSKTVRGVAEVPGGGLLDNDDAVSTFETLDADDIEGVTAECFNQQVFDDADLEWDDAVALVREYMTKHNSGGGAMRSGYKDAVARQTHLSDAQREAMLQQFQADATAPPAARPAPPVELDEPEPERVEIFREKKATTPSAGPSRPESSRGR